MTVSDWIIIAVLFFIARGTGPVRFGVLLKTTNRLDDKFAEIDYQLAYLQRQIDER